MGADGAALLAGGRFHEALAAFRQALQADPSSLALRIGLARACAGSGDALAAAAWLSDALRLAPEAIEPLELLADLLLSQGRHAQALPLYQRLLALPGARDANRLLHLGLCEEHLGQLEPAAAHYREALALAPRFLDAHVDLAGVSWRLEDFAGALAHAREAVALAPEHPFAQRVLGMALLNLDRVDEAEGHLRRALELQPEAAAAQLDLAFALLLAGRLEEGWAMYAGRWRDPRARRPAFYRPEHEWPGPSAPLAGQSIALYGEQGIGDMLQMLRYVPRLQALGARVSCVLPAELVELVEASFPGVACLRPGGQLQVQWHAALMDLPLRFGTTLADIPAEVPYLRAPEAARARWRERLRPWAARQRIGLAWSGSPAQVNNRNRAMPLGLLLSLGRGLDAQCFSLQKGEAGAWTDVRPAADELVDLTGEWRDFGDSAAMIEQLDLVITVDTAIAHLAGALGKPVWILLPPNPDWRWLLEREDSPWYPGARLFRRAAGEGRRAQVDRVRAALAAFMSSRA